MIIIAELKDLINELQEVTDWYLLGLCLGLTESRLREIEQDQRRNDERRREVLATWARQEKPTWSKVVHTLMEMGGHQVLASQIAEIYGNFLKYETCAIILVVQILLCTMVSIDKLLFLVDKGVRQSQSAEKTSSQAREVSYYIQSCQTACSLHCHHCIIDYT